jgi:hypothetical protein
MIIEGEKRRKAAKDLREKYKKEGEKRRKRNNNS